MQRLGEILGTLNGVTGPKGERFCLSFSELVLLDKIRRHWGEWLGSALASQTAPFRIQQRTLEVRANSGGAMTELTFMQETLLQKLNELGDHRFEKIRVTPSR